MPAYEVDYTIQDSIVVNADNPEAAEDAAIELIDIPEEAELMIEAVTQVPPL
jgi:hypothetical protein